MSPAGAGSRLQTYCILINEGFESFFTAYLLIPGYVKEAWLLALLGILSF